MDVARVIEGDMAARDYEAPLGDPHLASPFGVAQDAVKGVEETHDRLTTKWGSLENAFHKMDVDGSGQLRWQIIMPLLSNYIVTPSWKRRKIIHLQSKYIVTPSPSASTSSGTQLSRPVPSTCRRRSFR
jgi:hypothetical protein